MRVLVVVPTGVMKAYAQEVAMGMMIFSGLMDRFSANFMVTGMRTLAVAEVRMNSINKLATTERDAMSVGVDM